MLQKLEPRIEEYIKDHNGNHVIQKCIEVMEVEDKQVIISRYDNKVNILQTNLREDFNILYLSGLILHY